MPDPAEKLASPEELSAQDRQAKRNHENGRTWKNDECHAEHQDAEAEHGHRNLPRHAKRGGCGRGRFSGHGFSLAPVRVLIADSGLRVGQPRVLSRRGMTRRSAPSMLAGAFGLRSRD